MWQNASSYFQLISELVPFFYFFFLPVFDVDKTGDAADDGDIQGAIDLFRQQKGNLRHLLCKNMDGDDACPKAIWSSNVIWEVQVPCARHSPRSASLHYDFGMALWEMPSIIKSVYCAKSSTLRLNLRQGSSDPLLVALTTSTTKKCHHNGRHRDTVDVIREKWV